MREQTLEWTIDGLRKAADGLEILKKHAIRNRTEKLRYRGVGVETRIIPVDHEDADRLADLGWAWSSDVDDDRVKQLWTFAF